MAANTFVELNDTPSNYTGSGNKFLVVKGDESALNFTNISLEKVSDVNVTGAYVPVGGQVLQYSSAANEWRAMDNDPYSFGAGLLKSGGTIDVIASGGLVSNASGVYIQDIANVAGTYGNSSAVPQFTVNTKGQITAVDLVDIGVPSADELTADYVGNVAGTSGQIRVTGGTGNNSNATIDLVATGVTAAVYGNATHAPQITVDTYGRISNVTEIELSAGDGNSVAGLGYSSIAVSGQTTIAADKVEDDLTFVAGDGMLISTDASNDSITFSITGSVVADDIALGQISDVSIGSISDGQVIKWDSANNQFVPHTLVDNGILLTDLSGTNGVSYDNTSGEISLATSGAVAGTYGNLSNVAQVTVNDKGIVTNITNVSLSTGVTAGTYGNATLTPSFTIDASGRITDIEEVSSASYIQSLSWNTANDELSLSGGGNTVDLSTLRNPSFRGVTGPGQPLILAENVEDTLNFEGGTGISVTINSVTDTVTISATGDAAEADLSNSSISGLSDVGAIGAITDGQALVWNASSGEFQPGTVAGSYGNATVQAYLDAQGYSTTDNDSQTLSWNAGSNSLSISGGNSVDLSVLLDNVDSQAISLSGNVISITGDASTVDLGSLLGSVESNYGDSNVSAYLSAQGYATQSTIVAAITDSAPSTLDTLNELAAALGDDPNFATTTTNAIALKANSADLATVATSGDYTDLTNRPTIALSGSDLSYDGTTLDLSGVGAVGPQGNIGPTGATGNGITNATVSSGDLILTYSNTSVQNLGDITGPTGATGPQGPQGTTGPAGATGPQGATGPAGADGSDGADGSNGTDGVGVTNVNLVGGNLMFTYSNVSTQDVGNIQGPTGAQGPAGNDGADGADGTSISSGSVTNGVITLTMSDSSTINVSGNVEGAVGATGATGPQGVQGPAGADGSDGATGPQGAGLNDVSVTSASASGSGSLAYNSGTGVFTFTPPDLSSYLTSETDSQTLTLNSTAGQLAISSGNNVDLRQTQFLYSALSDLPSASSYHGAIAHVHAEGAMYFAHAGNWVELANASDLSTNTDAQTLSLSGNTVTISGSGSSVDLTPILGTSGGGGGIALTDLSATDGVEYSNVTGVFNLTDTGVSAGTYGSSTLVPRITVDAKGRVTSVTTQAVSGGGGGGGSGATVERFKLNYTSAGALDSITDTTGGISSVSIDSASGGDVTVAFTGYNFPPASIMIYGYVYASNKYQIAPLESSMGLREVAGGGSTGAPSLFGGMGVPTTKLRLREAETGASRGFGTTTHAWVQFVMYD